METWNWLNETMARLPLATGIVVFVAMFAAQKLSDRISLRATIAWVKRHTLASWFAERFTIPIVTSTAATLIAAGILYGGKVFLGPTDHRLNAESVVVEKGADLNDIEPSVQAGEVVRDDAKTNSDHPNTEALADGRSGVRRQALKPIINYCKTHSNVPLSEFAPLGGNDYQCKRCGQIGMLVQSITDGGLLFIVDKE